MLVGQITRQRGQLPVETTGFVGRDAELARLGALLGQARLVTVTGGGNDVGGIASTAPNGASSSAGGYPVQSPTSGTGVPWYQDPLTLLAISAVALMGSLLLWRREQLRAVVVRQH